MALPRVFASAFNLVKSGPLNYNSCKVIPRYFHLSNCAFAGVLTITASSNLMYLSLK